MREPENCDGFSCEECEPYGCVFRDYNKEEARRMNCSDCGALVVEGRPWENNWHRHFCVFWTKPFCQVEEKDCKPLWRMKPMDGKCPGCGASVVQNSQNGQTVYTCINKDCKNYNPVFLEAQQPLVDKNSGKHQPFEYDPRGEKG